MRTLICIFLSYIIAASFSELVSFNLLETEWTNILTYFWIIFSLPIAAAFLAGLLFMAVWAFEK